MTAPGAWTGALLGLAFGLGVTLIVVRIRARRVTFDQRLAPYLVPRPPTSALLGEDRAVTPFPTLERLVAPWVVALGRLFERFGSPGSELARRLDRAGRLMAPDQFRALQLVLASVGLAVGLAAAVSLRVLRGSPPVVLALLVLVCAGVGALLCDHWLSRRIAARESAMMLEFPTIAELLALAVSAGESPLPALERVTRSAHGEVSVELHRLLADIHAGAPLTTALERLADRTTVAPIARFAEGVAVAVERGTPLAEVLRAQAQDVRESARRELMEVGGRKEVLMMVPVVFLILPVTIAFAVFPSVITLRIGL